MIIFKPHEALSIINYYLPKNPIIVEAGAFNGNDTCKMAQLWPQGFIHAFEPVPELFSDLKRNTQNYNNVACHAYALSKKNGSAHFYVAEKPTKPGIPSQAGSLHAPKERLHYSTIQFPHTITVPTITLNSWAQQQKVKQVDFLWLDVQGHELAVLQASKQLLATVRAIFTEVGFFENYVEQPTYTELKNWLEQHGFTLVGRDFKNMAQWFFGNLLFVRT